MKRYSKIIKDKMEQIQEKINKEALNRNIKVRFSTLKRLREHKPYQSMTDDETLNLLLDKIDDAEKKKGWGLLNRK